MCIKESLEIWKKLYLNSKYLLFFERFIWSAREHISLLFLTKILSYETFINDCKTWISNMLEFYKDS